MKNTTITTSVYLATYGRRPQGRAIWGFCPKERWDNDDYIEHIHWSRGCKTYSEARREAVDHFTHRGVTEAIVCP